MELKEEIQIKHEAIPDDLLPIVDLTESQLEDIQMKDKFIKNIVNRLVAKQQPEGKCTVPFTVQPFTYTSCTSRLRAPQGSHRMGDQWHQL